MSDTDADLKVELDGLDFEIQAAKKNLPEYSGRHFNTEREKALIYCLRRAVELSEGSILCSKENLLAPIYVLTRGLLESLIWACWITKSDDNAQAYIDATKNELKRLARKNLETGHGKVVDTATKVDKTQELLNSDWVKDIRPRLRIEGAAKDVGLDKLYTQMYGFLSMFAHGIMVETNASLKDDMVGILAIANVLMECINLVVNNWIVARKQTPIKEIYAILQ
jgi:hypothetical protein